MTESPKPEKQSPSGGDPADDKGSRASSGAKTPDPSPAKPVGQPGSGEDPSDDRGS